MRGKTLKMALAAFVLIAGGMMSGYLNFPCPSQPAMARSDKQAQVLQWFAQYDDVRRKAQMSDAEKERSQSLLAAGITSCFGRSAQASSDKALANALLQKMVARYDRAGFELNALPQIAETRKLHEGYEHYFQEASGLFGDYLKVQNNLFATDASGGSLMGQLSQRKADLEVLDAANKQLDARLRNKYNIAPYALQASAISY